MEILLNAVILSEQKTFSHLDSTLLKGYICSQEHFCFIKEKEIIFTHGDFGSVEEYKGILCKRSAQTFIMQEVQYDFWNCMLF